MPILFRFVNRFDLYRQSKEIVNKIRETTGVIEYNLFGYWGASGIGKTSLLEAIYSYLQSSGIKNCIMYDCAKHENQNEIITFLNQESKDPGIAIIDHLEELDSSKSEIFLEASNKFIKNNIPWRIIFCASRLPDCISQLLRPEQRLIIQLPALMPSDTIEMINQIFPNLNRADKDFLIEYAAGYPQMISIFCCLLNRQKKIENSKIIAVKKNLLNRALLKIAGFIKPYITENNEIKKIADKKWFLWQSLLELSKSLNPYLKEEKERELFISRLCYLSLYEGFMPDSGKQLLNYIGDIMNKPKMQFDKILDFQTFAQICMNYSIISWEKNDYTFYHPLQDLLRKYISKFERESYEKAYKWIVNRYSEKYNQAIGKEKGQYLLKLSFFKYQLYSLKKESLFKYFLKEIKYLEEQNNFDAIETVNQEIKNSEIGRIFNIKKISEIAGKNY